MFLFARITPLNFAYAWCLSFRAPVVVWRTEFVHERLLRRFRRLRPYRLFTLDEWLLAHDACFDVWTRDVLPALMREQPCEARYRGRGIDFSRNLWQVLGVEFEKLFLLAAGARRLAAAETASPSIVEPWVARAFSREQLASLFPDVPIRFSRTHRLLENLYEKAVTAAHLARTILFALRSLCRPRRDCGEARIAWMGISPQEIPDRDHRLNFAWAAQYSVLPKNSVLFFPPCALTDAQSDYLTRAGIRWADPVQAFACLPWNARLRVLGTALRALCAALCALTPPILARFMARAPYWEELVEALRLKAYVTTSNSWPENPELAVMKARAVRSVIWSYSANSLRFALKTPDFRDVGVLRSVIVTGEWWVWNDASRDWLKQREAVAGPRLTVAGPLMCGNPANLALAPSAARKLLGVPENGLCVGVFDVACLNDRWREQFGQGPGLIDLDTYSAFYDGLLALLDRVPGSFLLIKPKREIGDVYREFPANVKALLSGELPGHYAQRVFMMDINVDPYLPITASDAVVGMTYTSPVLAACTVGRLGLYYDPKGRANCPAHRDLKALTVQSLDELVTKVSALAASRASGNTAAGPASVVPPSPQPHLKAMPELLEG